MARVIKNEITDYISINVTEDETPWSASLRYNRGDIVREGHFMYSYMGLSGTNTPTAPSLSPLSWAYLYPTNYFAMIDGKTSEKTTKIGEPLIFEISNNNRDTLSLLNVDAQNIKVEIIDIATSTVLWVEDRNIQDESGVVDFYTYCFNDFVFKKDNYFELPLYSSTTKIRITVDNGSNDASVGRLVLGRSFYIGEAEFTGNLSIESYSVKQTNEMGIANLIQRGSVSLENYMIRCPIESVPNLKRKRAEWDAIPLLFIIDDNDGSKLENLQIFGFWQTFDMELTNKRFSKMSLAIKGIL